MEEPHQNHTFWSHAYPFDHLPKAKCWAILPFSDFWQKFDH